MKIHVTQEDINQGERGQYSLCPIAVAIQRQTKSEQVEIGKNYVLIYKFPYMVVTDISRSARRFVRAFDRMKPVKPFNFMLKTTKET